MRTRCALALLTFALGANTVWADTGFGETCCADLEERIAELEATTARKGNRKISLTVSGYINEAVLGWYDGELSDVYQGTNDAARSRFRFVGDAKIDGDWSAGYLLEIGVRTSRLNRTDQFHAIGFITTDFGIRSATGLDLRHSAWWLQHKKYGRVWVGQTDQATERITEINLASTNQFLKHYGRWNGSFVLRLKNTGALAIGPPGTQVFQDGPISSNFRTWGQILPQSGLTGEGVPGEGDRYDLVKYDSPMIAGFALAMAAGDDSFWDVALRYAGEFNGVKLAGGVGFANWWGEGSLNDRGCSINDATLVPPGNTLYQNPYGDVSCQQLGLSASVMHVESGLFLTGAYGIKWDRYRDTIFQLTAPGPGRVDASDNFYSAQTGIEKKWFTPGNTTIYAEYEHYDTGAGISGNGETATGRPRSFNQSQGFINFGGGSQYMSGADIDVVGGGINQNFESAAMDLYLAYRRASADVYVSDNGVQDGPNSGTFEIVPIHMMMSGVRLQF